MTVPFYLDDDIGSPRIVRGLARFGIDAVTTAEVQMYGKTDHEHLVYAASASRVLCTVNFGDFLQLHWQWLNENRSHAGLVLIAQQRYSIGELVRRLHLLSSVMEPTDIAGRYEFLRDWGTEDA